MLAETEQPVREIQYVARGGAAELFDVEDNEVLMEGPAGTGKTRAILERINQLCESHDGIRVLVCRATRVSLTETVLVTFENKVLWPGHPAMSGDASRQNRHSYDYPNGSQIIVGGLDNPERILSAEYDLVYVAEATEITEETWETLLTRLRNHVMPWQQAICDCNPSYPSHWLNKRASSGKMRRILSRHSDNPSVTPKYLKTLAGLTGSRRARFFEGRWVAADGTVFGAEFDESRHVMDAFTVPSEWPWWVFVDPGYDHPCAIPWFTMSPSGRLYVADLRYQGGCSISKHAEWITGQLEGRNVRGMYCDPRHGFSRTAQSPKTIAEQFKDSGLEFHPWPRKEGDAVEAHVNAVRNLLSNDKLCFFRGVAADAITEMQSWMYKRTSGGQVPSGDDQFEDRSNHFIDCLLGFVAMNPSYEMVRASIHRVPVAAYSTHRNPEADTLRLLREQLNQ
jgi:PBSX family phage terminase large subunit